MAAAPRATALLVAFGAFVAAAPKAKGVTTWSKLSDPHTLTPQEALAQVGKGPLPAKAELSNGIPEHEHLDNGIPEHEHLDNGIPEHEHLPNDIREHGHLPPGGPKHKMTKIKAGGQKVLVGKPHVRKPKSSKKQESEKAPVTDLDTSFAAAKASDTKVSHKAAAAQHKADLEEMVRMQDASVAADAYYRDAKEELWKQLASHHHTNWSFAYDSSTEGVYVHWKPKLGEDSKPLKEMFWVHVPKTASSFSRTIFAYACGPKSFPFGKVWTGLVPRIGGDCGGSRAKEQAGKYHSWFHMPVPPRLQATGRGVVMMLRPPRQRLLSAAGHIDLCSHRECDQYGCGCLCCAGKWEGNDANKWGGGDFAAQGDSWGWSKTTRWKTVRQTRKRGLEGYMDVLNRSNALKGCYAKMMNGIGCNEEHNLTDQEVQGAADFVEQKASFVGLTSEFEKSVCLFHAMYGGPMYHFEVKDFIIKHGEAEEPHDESALGGWQDEPDNVVYEAALRRFKAQWEAHKPQATICMNTVRKWVNEDWKSGSYKPVGPEQGQENVAANIL